MDICKVRRNIMTLSSSELAFYQSKLEDIFKVGVLGFKWQELGLLRMLNPFCG
jgi:hypothetical protein